MYIWIDGWMGDRNIWIRKLTEDGAGWHGLLVDPEGDLGQDDRHDARNVGLDEEKTHLPLQVEVYRHDDVLTWRQITSRSYSSISNRGSRRSQEI